MGVAVDSSDNIILADTLNHRIQVFDSTGKLIRFGPITPQGNGLLLPSDIEVDSSDNIIITDSGNHRIVVFDSNGNFLLTFGSQGSGNGQFIAPTGITVNGSDKIIVVDTRNRRVQLFESVTPNHSPIANAGKDHTVNEMVSVTLNGTASSDPDDGILTFSCIQLTGTNVTLSDASSPTPTFTTPIVDEVTTLIFHLVVYDGIVSASDETMVEVLQVEPTRFALSSSIDGNTYSVLGKAKDVRPFGFVIKPNESVHFDLGGGGELELSIPKKIIDGIHTITTRDQKTQIRFEEISSNASSTTIRFIAPDDTDAIEIFGATVVPEFPITSIVFATVIALFLMIPIFSNRNRKITREVGWI